MKNFTYYNIKSTLLICLISFFGLKFFESTPIEEVMIIPHTLFLGTMGLITFTLLIRQLMSGNSFNIFIIYFLALIIIIPLWSMLRSNIVFGQPYYFGILSERNWLVICSGFVLYSNILKNSQMIDIIERTFLRLSTITLVIFSSVYLFYDLSQFSDYLFVEETDLRGYRLKLNLFFINLGLIYNFIKFYQTRKSYNLLLFILFFFYTLFIVQGRAYLIQIITCLGIFIFYQLREQSFAKKITSIIFYLSFIILFVIGIILFNGQFAENLSFMFNQLISVAAGDISYDPSANSRIIQSILALSIINESTSNLWFGAGKISHQWEKGYEGIFGHFYPADLGLLGGVFEYGILGIIFLNIIPMIACFIVMKKVKTNNHFVISLKYLLLFYILSSINTGNFFFTAQEYILIFFILMGLYKTSSVKLDTSLE